MEFLAKHFTLLSILCYITGFITLNIHLNSYGISESDFLNHKYLIAGIHYLIFISIIIIPKYIKIKFNVVTFSKFFDFLNYYLILPSILFTAYSTFILRGNIETSNLLYFLGGTLIYNLIYNSIIESYYPKKEEIITEFFTFLFIIFGTFFIFGNNYKNIKNELGGAELSKKLILTSDSTIFREKFNISFSKDTLNVIYENENELFFEHLNKVYSISKKGIIGTISCKEK
jgi:hypothetical protein